MDLFNNEYYLYERLIIYLFSLVPTFILMLFVLYTDRKNKEPAKNIVICLLSGILTISLAGYLEGFTLPYFSNNLFLTYSFAFLEEISKILIFYLFIFDNKHYDDLYDGVVYMSLIALSFAGLENIKYAFSESTVSNSISLAIMRDLTTIPLHVICGIVIGYFFSLGYFTEDKTKKIQNYSLAIIVSSFIHGSYNTFMNIISGNYNSVLMIFLFQTIPLLLCMIILMYIAYRVVFATLDLNDIYENNMTYDNDYRYLMTKDEYLSSNLKIKREKLHHLTKLRKRS